MWGCILYEIIYVEISTSGPEKLVLHIFLIIFQNEVDFFLLRERRKILDILKDILKMVH